MSNGARIKVLTSYCEARHKLSEGVRLAIQNVYTRTAEVEIAQRAHRGMVEAAALLQSAREECLRAEHAYDAHVQEHGCMAWAKPASA